MSDQNSTSKMERPSFTIIRRRGMPMYAYLPDGTRVEREMSSTGFEQIFVEQLRGFVRCASYDDHFIYAIPKHLAQKYPGPVHRCTCGSMAIFTGSNAYVMDASPQGKMFLCHAHATTGQHATGGARWV